jgi:transposase-like protein
MHFCPHLGCDYRGWLGKNNLRANGHPHGGLWRQFQCPSCEGYFLEHQGTMFHGKQAAVELIVRVLACLAEGLGIRATARVFEVAAHTVLQWLVEAAEQLPVFRANNPPLHAHEKAPQSFPEAALRGDAGGRSAH